MILFPSHVFLSVENYEPSPILNLVKKLRQLWLSGQSL